MICWLESCNAWRTSLMHRASDSSVATTFGQTAWMISSLVSSRPGRSTRKPRTSKLFGRSRYRTRARAGLGGLDSETERCDDASDEDG
jgi:hypothetical protein